MHARIGGRQRLKIELDDQNETRTEISQHDIIYPRRELAIKLELSHNHVLHGLVNGRPKVLTCY